jgi:putative transposase
MPSGFTRFCLSFRDVEDLLAERCIIVSYETIRHWCQKFGPDYARKLKRRQGRLGDTWLLDELFLKINGELQYIWRAVDQDGDVIDILVQSRLDQHAAERFLQRLLRGEGKEPFRIITDTPEPRQTADLLHFGSYGWQSHCRGLYQTPMAA